MPSRTRTSYRYLPAVVGLTLFGGFVVLLVLWLSSPALKELPGLFDFPSAYIGDGILLPLTATILASCTTDYPARRRVTWVAAVGGLVGAIAGATTQALWLADDHPNVNWTLPRAHHFNIAGWWHASYVVTCAFVLGALIAALVWKSSAAGAESIVHSQIRQGLPALAISCTFIYVAIAAFDSRGHTFASQTTLVALGAVILSLGLLAGVVLGRRVKLLARPCLQGLLPAVGVAIALNSTWSGQRTQVLGVVGSVLAAAGVALLPLIPGRGMEDEYLRLRPAPATVALGGVALVVWLPTLWTNAALHVSRQEWQMAWPWGVAFAAAVTLIPLTVVDERYLAWLWNNLDVMVTFMALCIISIGALPASLWTGDSDAGQVVSIAVAIVISLVLFPVLWARFADEIEQERGPAMPDGSFGLTDVAKRGAGPLLAMLYIAAASASMSLLAFTLAAADNRRYLPDYGWLSGIRVLLAAGIALSLAAGALARIHRQRPGAAWVQLAASAVVAGWPTVLVVLGLRAMPPVTPVAIAAGCLLALWTANTATNNIALLRDAPLDRAMIIYLAVVLLSGFTTGYFALTVALAESPTHVYTWAAGISAAAATVAAHGVLVVISGHALALAPAANTRHGLTHNLVQDATVITLLFVLALVVPATTILHIPPADGLWRRLFATLSICMPLLSFFLYPYKRMGQANLRHLASEVATRAPDPAVLRLQLKSESGVWRRNALLVRVARSGLPGNTQDRYLRVLNAHIRNQNLIGTAVTVLSVVGLLATLMAKEGLTLGYAHRRGKADEDRPDESRPLPLQQRSG